MAARLRSTLENFLELVFFDAFLNHLNYIFFYLTHRLVVIMLLQVQWNNVDFISHISFYILPGYWFSAPRWHLLSSSYCIAWAGENRSQRNGWRHSLCRCSNLFYSWILSWYLISIFLSDIWLHLEINMLNSISMLSIMHLKIISSLAQMPKVK